MDSNTPLPTFPCGRTLAELVFAAAPYHRNTHDMWDYVYGQLDARHSSAEYQAAKAACLRLCKEAGIQ